MDVEDGVFIAGKEALLIAVDTLPHRIGNRKAGRVESGTEAFI